ncbi:RecA protein homolog [Gemmatimonas aurantiaca T-27]|uniref:Protein RecA n=1 Tax=Gemmatimonas aurantiaca (strain DSM 14586 / JCM 11422 / NBRC 100505 / T-27) TaxID=379066 RepID=C1AAH5_GEMAT|nr:hypothetical protein [Gemmatimonas aurantiaca]BAH39773.1 RecA protein homolog [Gemmatimonas aurantiaca T-27]
MSSAILPQLVAQVEAIVAGTRRASSPWPTGVPALDRALGGGIPRGRITELVGPLAVGKSGLLRQVITQVLATGSWAAWIDATRTLAPEPWTGMGARLVVVRLPTPHRAAWTADLLLRSGVFGLVVIDGAPSLSRVQGVRLGQLARERDAACVVLEHTGAGPMHRHRLTGTTRLHLTVRTRQRDRLQAPQHAPQHASQHTATTPMTMTPAMTVPGMQVTVEKGGLITGSRAAIEVDRVIVLAHRLCAHSEVPDRRGVAHSTRRPWIPRQTDSTELQHADTVSGGGIGVVTRDLYGIGVSGPVHFGAERRAATQRAAEQRTESRAPESQAGEHLTESPSRLGEAARTLANAPALG